MKHEQALTSARKRLALFLDGTWNTPEDATSVWRLYLMLAERGEDGVPQQAYYDDGVGTHWFDRVTGGAFGAGLSENVRRAYRWLMERFNPGDEIFIFGFSRGAFTARSLAGLVARCGLLKPAAPMSFLQVYERYQQGDAARPIYRLKYLERRGERNFSFEENVLLEHAWYEASLIKFIGVWDTVGALGIPFGNIRGVSSRTLGFHNTHLSKIVQNSFQALALDEYRKPYWAVLWTQFIPDERDPAEPARPDDRQVEQRWFSGAHANVGGGYRNDLLPQRPLAWLQDKARRCGLGFRSRIAIDNDDDLQMLPRDSYGEFLHGAWKLVKGGRHYVRWVMSDPVRKVARPSGRNTTTPGWVQTVNERIDRSVFQRCQIHRDYRPDGLREWAQRRKLDLEAIIAAPGNFPDLWSPIEDARIETAIPIAAR